MKDYLKIAFSLLQQEQTCCLSSINKQGFPQTRAMLMPIKYEKHSFWIHTNSSSNKVKQFKQNSKGCLYFYNQNKFEGVTLLGNVDVLENDDQKKEFWEDEYQVYYANGEGMSDFCVLRFDVLSGEYYHNFSVEEFNIQ